jgi:hypothetical protein
MTRLLPYHETTSELSVIAKINNRVLPTRPPSASDESSLLDTIDNETWHLLQVCWNFSPDNRPTCQQIMGFLQLVGLTPHQLHDPDSSNHIVEFRSAMRVQADGSINLAKVGRIFNEVKTSVLAPLDARVDNLLLDQKTKATGMSIRDVTKENTEADISLICIGFASYLLYLHRLPSVFFRAPFDLEHMSGK